MKNLSFLLSTKRGTQLARAGLLIGGCLFAIGCSSDDDKDEQPTGPSQRAVLENYSANLYAAYTDSVKDAEALSDQVDAFLADPSEDSLAATRDAWFASRKTYMLLEGARFYDGPIDVNLPDGSNYEALLNSWPLDEAFIDYTTNKDTGEVDESSGIVNQPDLLAEITPEGLDALNADGGDENISVGYHAVEFLLWGQALKDVGPGERPASDYASDGPRQNADRRVAYLKQAVDGIAEHLKAVRDAWAPDASYRKQFIAGGNDSIARALSGLGKFSKAELAGQRINAAYKSKDRRDQHDCFSSLTLDDYERDARGVLAMYEGDYGDNDGPGLDELVRAANSSVDAQLKQQLQTSIDAIVAVPKPFEAAIVGADSSAGRVAIRAAVQSLRSQGDQFADAASALGLTITVPDDL